MQGSRNECGLKKIGCMMVTASTDKSDLILGVGGEPVIQVVMSTQTSKAMPSANTMCNYVKPDGLDTMRQREHSKQKSHSCDASSTDGEQVDRDTRKISKESSTASRFFQRWP